MVADTSFGESTYWATASDLFKDEDSLIGYIIDPIGVANLLKVHDFCAEKLLKNGWNSRQAPYLHAMALSSIWVLYVDAVDAIREQVSIERRERDAVQEHLWRLCYGFALERITTPYIADSREREILMGISARKIVEGLRRIA